MPSIKNLSPEQRTRWVHRTSSKPAQAMITDQNMLKETEAEEVQNLPFESAKLKASHYSWTPRCSDGIQAMLAGRQQRHDIALQAFLSSR